MNTPSTGNSPFSWQVQQALLKAGAVIVSRCAVCGEFHESECAYAGNSEAQPFVSVLPANDGAIVDGIEYDGRGKPPMVAADDANWRRM